MVISYFVGIGDFNSQSSAGLAVILSDVFQDCQSFSVLWFYRPGSHFKWYSTGLVPILSDILWDWQSFSVLWFYRPGSHFK
jgi:hypothetical protein